MRITQSMMVTNQLDRLQTRLAEFERSQSQLGTGKVMLRPSDDPAAANRSLVLRGAQRAREQEARNAADAQAWLHLADSKLQSVVERLHRARDLMVAAANENAQPAHDAMALEVSAIRDEVLALANSENAGRPLFAGTTLGPAAVVDPTTGEVTYGGNAGRMSRRVGEHDVVEVNVTARELFAISDTDPTQGLFATLGRVVTAMGNGDEAAVADQLDALDGHLRDIGDGQARIGAAANRVEAAMQRNVDDQHTIRTELSEVEDVDIAEAVMELQTQEVAYQATLGALGRVLQPSLIDFLR